MGFAEVTAWGMRIILVVFAVLYAFKRKFKQIIPTAVTFALSFLPLSLWVLFGIRIDLLGVLLYYAIIFAAIFLGSVYKFYDRYAWWDVMIHAMSGVASVSLGLALTRNMESLSKINALFFCLTLAVFIHTIWEIAEYILDCIFHTNNQRWQKHHDSINHKAESAIQPAGLVDTMNDAIACVASAAFACAVWWVL